MTEQNITVSYNKQLRGFGELLAGIRQSGDFFASGLIESPMPKLEIDGIGTISFPILSQQAKALVTRCERAPFGRGQDTLIDTDVRKVWQLAPSKLRLGGKTWARTLDTILAKVTEGLGCADRRVSAELYKLLVYDKGSFFKPHRDSEKADGMFGTLLIVLPSVHTGGELIIRHAGRETTVDPSSAEVSELAFAAFYADCEHEVLPITKGHRVCLVYNLMLDQTPSRRTRPAALAVPDQRAEVAAAAEQLKQGLKGSKAPPKLVWLLEHQYSPAGLGFSTLKNADAARASVLRAAALQADCAIHLGIVHIGETGPAEYVNNHWSSGRYGRRGWYTFDDENEDDVEDEDDDEDGVEVGSDDFEIVEVSDGWCYVDQWISTEERAAGFGAVPIGDGEILPIGALDEAVPDKQRIMEATGNEGASFERAYHRAAIVIWPLDRHVDVLLQAGVAGALVYLDDRVSTWIASGGDEVQKRALREDAKHVLAAWRKDRRADSDFTDWLVDDELDDGYSPSFQAPDHQQPDRSRMVALLSALNDTRLLEQFIRDVLIEQFDGSESQAVDEATVLLGPRRTGTLLKAIVRERMRIASQGCVTLLRCVIEQSRESAAQHNAWRVAARGIATACIEALQVDQEKSVRSRPTTRAQSGRTPEVTGETLANLLECLMKLGNQRIRAAATAAIVANDAIFDTRDSIVPALCELVERDVAVMGDKENERLWAYAAETLLERSGQPPKPPTDWRQAVRIGCKCPDCSELVAFVRDPVANVHRFRIRKDRRQHLHSQIDRHGLDMTHVTERSGSPQTLVCEKTRRSYERQREAYRADIVELNTLARLAGSPPKTLVDLMKRIATAMMRAAALSIH